MENTTQLLQRQFPEISQRSILIADANDASLRDLDASDLTLHADDILLAPDQWKMLPNVPANCDLIIIPLPKSLERLRFLLAALAADIHAPVECWLVGPSKGGIRGALKHFEQAVTDVVLIDSARHCKLYGGLLQPKSTFSAEHWRTCTPTPFGEILSYPGVFCHGRLDEGSALLLEALSSHLSAPSSGKNRAFDVGCGAGVLSMYLAKQGWQVQAADVSACAVQASQETLAHNQLQAQVMGGDLFSAFSGKVPLIVTNPPFHERRQRTTNITQRLIETAPRYLAPQGECWMVANRELPYFDWLNSAFSTVEIIKENKRFRIYRGR